MEIKIKSPRGVKLLTEQKYCIENIGVVPELQNKTVTPSDTQQVVTPDADFAGLGSVTVEPGTVTADATATADDIRLGKTAYGASGKMTGTIADYDGSSEPTSGKSLFAKLVDKTITKVAAEDLTGATKISASIFASCKTLISVMIPDSVTSIDDYAFQFCSSLTSITIPDSVKSIGNYTFNNCIKLTRITIPSSITDVGAAVFRSCSSLINVTVENGLELIQSYMFQACSSLTSITLPNSVTRIQDMAFYDCSSLTAITIGNRMLSISSRVFANCSTSTELGGTYTILATTPPTIRSDTFQDSKINKIIVPVGTSAAYKAATNWSALADKIEEATE